MRARAAGPRLRRRRKWAVFGVVLERGAYAEANEERVAARGPGLNSGWNGSEEKHGWFGGSIDSDVVVSGVRR